MFLIITVPELKLTDRLSSAFSPTTDWASAACLAMEYWAARRAVKRLKTVIARTMKKRAPMISAWALRTFLTFILQAESFSLKGEDGPGHYPGPAVYCAVTSTTWLCVAPLAKVATTVMAYVTPATAVVLVKV